MIAHDKARLYGGIAAAIAVIGAAVATAMGFDTKEVSGVVTTIATAIGVLLPALVKHE